MLLIFGAVEIPTGVIQERVVELFRVLMGGGELKKVRALINNPTVHKGNQQSIQLLCADLSSARDSLVKIGLGINVQKAINEIDFLITDLKDLKDLEESL